MTKTDPPIPNSIRLEHLEAIEHTVVHAIKNGGLESLVIERSVVQGALANCSDSHADQVIGDLIGAGALCDLPGTACLVVQRRVWSEVRDCVNRREKPVGQI